MRSSAFRRRVRRFACALCASGAIASAAVRTPAQEQPPATDPRVGLKAGLRDAGEAAKNMRRISGASKPKGFFDPSAPGGLPTMPEPERKEPDQPPWAERQKTPEEEAADAARAARLNFANSDLAFRRNHVVVGSFNGFNTYDVDSTNSPRLLVSVVCPGGQGDVSVHGNLLFMSVEQTRGRVDCGTQGVQTTVSKDRFRGVRIFDITDLTKPKQIAAVQTCRGSHTHTLVVDPDDKDNVYIYGQGTGTVRSGDELEGCSNKDPKEDPNTALFSIDVIQVPLAAPQKSKVVSHPRIFADPTSGAVAGLWQGGGQGVWGQRARMTNQCHDITVFPELGLAAGACAGNGLLLDISDPVNPVRLDAVSDKSFGYWHSATFNNDGTKVVFTDEWGGGTRPRCRASDPETWGANAIFDVVDRKLQFRSYYKLPAPQTEQENCVAHNGSTIPMPGRDIMVQGWYQGGISVFDFTDSANPIEIAYFDRGPVDANNLVTGGFWSAYWYNGHIYGSEIARGIDIFTLTPGEHLTQNEIDAASSIRVTEFNPQEQQKVVWPATAVVAQAYLDQLERSNALPSERITALRSLLDRADSRRQREEAALGGELDAAATELETGAANAMGRDAARMTALAATLRGIKIKVG